VVSVEKGLDLVKCTNCDQIINENKRLRTNLSDTNKNYVEVVNRNLALEKFIRDNGLRVPHGE
jgi:hypothetical protein